MANKALVIDVNSRTALNGVLDKWETIGNMQAFTRDIITPELDEKADKSAIVSGIPTVFARANMFSLALSYSGDSMTNTSAGMIAYYNELIDEWKGLIACIALDSGKLQIKRIDLTYSDGKGKDKTGNLYESKGAFGNMLFNRKPLWTEQLGEPGEQPPFINIIKYNNQVVGGTSPECLLFTAPSYSIPSNENYAPKGKFRDPVKYGKNLDETKWLALYAYVKNLIEKLKNDFTAYYQGIDPSLRPNYDHIANRLQLWLEEIKGKIQDDVEKAAANPVSGFTSPFSIIFNYSDSMYGSNGVVLSHQEKGYTEFKAEDLLLPRGSEIARVMLNPQALEHYSELPLQLLEATMKGSDNEEKAYFALPLSVIGLKIFGSSVSALVGQQDKTVAIKSRLSAEYDPEARDNNLTVYLTLNSEDNKSKTVVVVYTVKSDRYIMNSDILLWPNFISNQWNKYYMYSEMPAGVSSIDFNAIPFVGEQMDGKFLPIVDTDYNPVYLTEEHDVQRKKKGIESMLLVTADHRVADSPYKYEIYQSNKPFAGLKLTSGTDREGKEKMAGFLLVRYAPEGTGSPMLPENMMDRRVVFKNKGIHLGFDFGSTNSSVAYYDPNDDDDPHAKGLEFKNRRISLFGNDGIEGRHQPKDFFFFSKKPTQSNALKSVLTLHDQRRMPNGNDSFREMPVAGGMPCFMSNMPLKAVTGNTISLDFGNGVEATLINSMKWSDSPVDKAYKTAYLRTLLLMVYAELFKKGLKPERLNWSYPSTMERSTILNHYNPIWKSLGGFNVSPIREFEGGDVIPLVVTDISSQHSGDSLGKGMDLGSALFGSGSSQQSSGYDFGLNLGGNTSTSNDMAGLDWIEGVKPQETVVEKVIDLDPSHDGPDKQLEFHPINTAYPMTEACASANFTAQTAAVRRKVVYCFDVGGSTTDISALFSLKNGDPYMIKQNSIRFAAQKISQAIRKMPDEFKEVLMRVCEKFQLKLIGFNVGPSRYNADTAPYYYEQIVDILNTDELEYFYSCIAERCPRLFAVNMYVTGLIMFYAGQLFRPLVKAINANRGPGAADVEGIEPVFEGKGARIFDWLCTKDMRMAESYYKSMFKAGAQSPNLPDDRIDLSKLRSGKTNSDVKFEVSKGLASENGRLMEPTEWFEIFGENGFVGYAPDKTEYKYSFDTKLTPEWMCEIGGFIRQPRPNSECFTQFLSIYGGAVQKILGINMDVNEMRQGLEHMDIEQYITQEVPRFKEALARSRDNNQTFDYVAPIIIIEGLKFYDKHLLKCFKK